MRSCTGSLIMLPGLRDDWAHCRQQWQWVPLLLKRVIQSLRGHCRLYSAGTYRPHTLRHSDTAASIHWRHWRLGRLISCFIVYLDGEEGDSDQTRTHWGHACSRNHYRCIQLPICHRTPLCTPPPLRLWLLSQNMPYAWLMSVIFVHFGYCQFHHAALASHCRCDMQQNDANPVDLHTLGPSILFPRSVLKWPSKSRNEQIWIYDSPIC